MENLHYLTRKEAAALLRCHETTIWRWVKSGMLKAYGIGGKVLYKRSDIEGLLIEL